VDEGFPVDESFIKENKEEGKMKKKEIEQKIINKKCEM
jgi:hypothetical protein